MKPPSRGHRYSEGLLYLLTSGARRVASVCRHLAFRGSIFRRPQEPIDMARRKRRLSRADDQCAIIETTTKRLCQTRESERSISTLELLPTEILQQIFFAALNGNLFRAAPRIAVKLSGSQAIYRAAALVAFFHRSIPQLRDVFNVDYLLQEITQPLPSWELRSMVKVVYGSKWCTLGWWKALTFDILAHAVARFEKLAVKSISPDSVEKVQMIKNRTAELRDLDYPGMLHGTGDAGRAISLNCYPFGIILDERPVLNRTDTNDREEIPWKCTIHWQLNSSLFGTIPSCYLSSMDDLEDSTPYREIWARYVGLRDERLSRRHWSVFYDRMRCAVEEDDAHYLVRGLQVDYLFYPEQAPYKIPAELFRIAARNDALNGFKLEAYSCLVALFEIDPFSLPRGSPELMQWAKGAARNMRNHIFNQESDYCEWRGYSLYGLVDEGQREESLFRSRLNNYRYQMQREILRYMKIGTLSIEPDLLSPLFVVPKLDTSVPSALDLEQEGGALPLLTHEDYSVFTVPQLRDMLKKIGVSPHSVGSRKIQYINRLMWEDRRGNRNEELFELRRSRMANPDPELNSLLEFADGLPTEPWQDINNRDGCGLGMALDDSDDDWGTEESDEETEGYIWRDEYDEESGHMFDEVAEALDKVAVQVHRLPPKAPKLAESVEEDPRDYRWFQAP